MEGNKISPMNCISIGISFLSRGSWDLALQDKIKCKKDKPKQEKVRNYSNFFHYKCSIKKKSENKIEHRILKFIYILVLNCLNPVNELYNLINIHMFPTETFI